MVIDDVKDVRICISHNSNDAINNNIAESSSVDERIEKINSNTKAYAYALVNKINSHMYIGSTINLRERIVQHNSNSGKNRYTHRYKPWNYGIVVSGFVSVKEARAFEYRWKHRTPTSKVAGWRAKVKRAKQLVRESRKQSILKIVDNRVVWTKSNITLNQFVSNDPP